MKITHGQITDKGLNPKRLANEDSLLAMPERGLFMVADGVGGRLGGARASQGPLRPSRRSSPSGIRKICAKSSKTPSICAIRRYTKRRDRTPTSAEWRRR